MHEGCYRMSVLDGESLRVPLPVASAGKSGYIRQGPSASSILEQHGDFVER